MLWLRFYAGVRSCVGKWRPWLYSVVEVCASPISPLHCQIYNSVICDNHRRSWFEGKPLQRSLLSCNPDTNIYTDPGSVCECVRLLEIFGGTACAYVVFHDKENIIKNLSDGYKAIRSAARAEDPKSSFFCAGYFMSAEHVSKPTTQNWCCKSSVFCCFDFSWFCLYICWSCSKLCIEG